MLHVLCIPLSLSLPLEEAICYGGRSSHQDPASSLLSLFAVSTHIQKFLISPHVLWYDLSELVRFILPVFTLQFDMLARTARSISALNAFDPFRPFFLYDSLVMNIHYWIRLLKLILLRPLLLPILLFVQLFDGGTIIPVYLRDLVEVSLGLRNFIFIHRCVLINLTA